MKRAAFLVLPCLTICLGSVDASRVFAADSPKTSSEEFSFEKGIRGPRGHKGHKGKRGACGKRGHPGVEGKVGPTGPMGPQGPIGIQGPQGPVGSIGPKGNTGPTGPIGPTGATGATGATGPTGDAGPMVDELHTYALEEFVSGGVASGTIGALGWSATDGAGITYIAAEQNHPGILQMAPSVTGLSTLYTFPGYTTDTGDSFELNFIVRPSMPPSGTILRIGLADNLPGEPTNGIYFEFNGLPPYWQIITKQGASVFTQNTLISAIPGAWYNFKIKRDASGLLFTINGTPFALPSNIPTATLTTFIQTNISTIGSSVDVDYMSIQWPNLVR